jgi:hypothetical protein
MTAYGQTVSHVSSSQAAAGAHKAGSILNQINANSQYTSFGRKPGPAPKPVAPKSLSKGATDLVNLQTEWNALCELFGWRGTGGRRRSRRTKRRSTTTRRKKTQRKRRGRTQRTKASRRR